MNENEQIAVKHKLLDSVWGAQDAEILPIINDWNKSAQLLKDALCVLNAHSVGHKTQEADDFWDYCFPMNIIGDRLPNWKNLYETLGNHKKETPMTSSANDEWNHFDLKTGIEELEKRIRQLKRLSTNAWETEQVVKQLRHTIDFIEYNMREMEIIGGNGDE